MEPADAEGLARAMLEITPEKGRRIGRNARLQIIANHDWEQVVERTEAVYSAALSQ